MNANGNGQLLQAPEEIGTGLLPPNLEQGRTEYLVALQAAYAQVFDGRVQNFGLWERVRGRIVSELKARFVAHGLEAPPFGWDQFWSNIDLPIRAADPALHVGLVRATMTNYGPRVAEQIVYRHKHGGNNHVELVGTTGLGKSSGAVEMADWTSRRITGKPLEPAKLKEHLSIDVTELPRKLKGKLPGESVIQDEYVALAGQGARTFQNLFENIEDTLRGSGINLFVISPRRQDHGAMHIVLDAIMWDPRRKYTVFMAWLGKTPMGLVALPWMRSELYEVYKPWKDANVDRTKSGIFRDNTYLMKLGIMFFEDPRPVKYLTKMTGKPNKGDFEDAIEWWMPQMMSAEQTKQLAGFLHRICNRYNHIQSEIESLWGVAPNEGLEKVAVKCYKE